MLKIRREDLPFSGSSYRFVGADHDQTGICAYLFSGEPGTGPGPHRHPYDEIQFIQEGRALYTVNGHTFEAGAGDVVIIKAGEIHSFQAVGNVPLVQIDVHVSPRFIQENIPVQSQLT